MNDGQDGGLNRYLLGQSTDEEKERIEAQFFADDDLFERLLEIDTDLVDGYVEGTLPPDHRALLEVRITRSVEFAQRVEIARALARRSDTVLAAPAESRRPAWIPMLLAASVLLAAGLLFTARETAHLRTASRDLQASRDALTARLGEVERNAASEAAKAAELSRQLAAMAGTASTGPPPTVVSFLLRNGLTRGSGAGNVVRIPRKAALVQLEIPLATPAQGGSTVSVETAEGKPVARLDGIPMAPGDAVLRVTLPESVLPAGDYVVSASSRGSRPSVLAEVAFRVVR